ncbi:MAG: SH3 domain-containing protein [bacterium]|nr:SH3 domain-containing protein [bacterium]
MKKLALKLARMILISLIFAAGIYTLPQILSADDSIEVGGYAYTTASKLNYRTAANTSGKRLGSFALGTKVKVLDL